MKSHRRLISPENPVNFLKIILSEDTASEGIRLPQKFTEEYGKYISEKVTLKVPNGDVWHVKLHKSEDEIWLKYGWGKVAEHYGLEFMHLLLFQYEGVSTFGLIIFDPTASEIQYPKSRDRVKNTVTKDAGKCPVSSDDSKIIILDDDTSSSSSMSEDKEHVIKIHDEGECSKKRERFEAAKANFRSDKPFFMVYITVSHLTSCGVILPAGFRRKLLKGYNNHRNCLLQLQKDGSSKAWKVAAHNDYLGNADWLMFVEDNGIQVGDICVFELIHKDKNVLGVTILRS